MFVNSQVFRIGGDEFAVIITNRDYYDRDVLFASLQSRYNECLEDSAAPPWKMYRTSCGMSIYEASDKDYTEVFARV